MVDGTKFFFLGWRFKVCGRYNGSYFQNVSQPILISPQAFEENAGGDRMGDRATSPDPAGADGRP